MKLRASILRGHDAAAGRFVRARSSSSIKPSTLTRTVHSAHYRIAEVFFFQRNYQSSANAYRAAIDGDGEPRWTEVWSHIQLGKIFDITASGNAIGQYRQATQTNDNTFGALEEARKYLQKAYERPKEKQ